MRDISWNTLTEVLVLQFLKYLFSADFKTVKEIWKRSPLSWWKLFWHKWNQPWREVRAGSGQANGTDPGRIEASWGNCFKMELEPLERGGNWGSRHFISVWMSVWVASCAFSDAETPYFSITSGEGEEGGCLLNGALWEFEDDWLLWTLRFGWF